MLSLPANRRASHRLAASALVAVMTFSAAGLARAQDAKPRIAVLALDNNTTFSFWGDRLGLAAADELTTQLVNSNAYSLVERRQVEQILAEQNLGASGAVAAATAARIGELLGAQAVLVGSITKFSIDRKSAGLGPLSASFAEAESSLDVRVVDTSTGEIVLVGEGSGKKRFGGASYKDYNFESDFDQGIAQEALRPAVEEAVRAIVEGREKIARIAPPAPTARVVGSRDGSIYIDRGENAGVEVGDRVEVLRVTDQIKDADGNILDEITTKVGVLQVVRVLSRSSICDVIEGEAAEGDTVKPAGG